ncbi:MAG: hypothetical protein V7K88_16900 [Nostoc sp.]
MQDSITDTKRFIFKNNGRLVGFRQKTSFNPVTDVQVLCPITRGIVGTHNLNAIDSNK